MIKESIITYMLILFVAIIGCSNSAKDNLPQNENPAIKNGIVTIDSNYNGKVISLIPGQNLIVQLEANPSTGYRWEIVHSDESTLLLTGKEFKQNKAAPGMVGVGGMQIYNFKVVQKGNMKLKLEYSKPLPSEDDIVKYFEVDLTVK